MIVSVLDEKCSLPRPGARAAVTTRAPTSTQAAWRSTSRAHASAAAVRRHREPTRDRARGGVCVLMFASLPRAPAWEKGRTSPIFGPFDETNICSIQQEVMASAPSSRHLPRRDDAARSRLAAVANRARPVTLARERSLPVVGSLGEMLPGAALQRGTVVRVDGAPGAGATSLAFALAAAATQAGEWVGAVDLFGTLGAEAAAAAGVALERFPIVRLGSGAIERWATVVAALLDGVGMVLAELPRHARVGDARRLAARARERGAVLVVLPTAAAQWPGDVALHLVAEGGPWSGLEPGAGLLASRVLRLRVEGRGAAARVRRGELARTG